MKCKSVIRQTDRQSHTETDQQTGRQTETKKDKHKSRQTQIKNKRKQNTISRHYRQT